MGYHTEFFGSVRVEPPLNDAEIEYLHKFNQTRRMKRTTSPYFVDGDGYMGQECDSTVIDYNRPHDGQPGLWCQWVPSEDGAFIEWDGCEKFYDSVEWMQYLIDHFLKPGALAKSELPFLQANHVLNGRIRAEGEDGDDRWVLIVTNNAVTTEALTW